MVIVSFITELYLFYEVNTKFEQTKYTHVIKNTFLNLVTNVILLLNSKVVNFSNINALNPLLEAKIYNDIILLNKLDSIITKFSFDSKNTELLKVSKDNNINYFESNLDTGVFRKAKGDLQHIMNLCALNIQRIFESYDDKFTFESFCDPKYKSKIKQYYDFILRNYYIIFQKYESLKSVSNDIQLVKYIHIKRILLLSIFGVSIIFCIAVVNIIFFTVYKSENSKKDFIKVISEITKPEAESIIQHADMFKMSLKNYLYIDINLDKDKKKLDLDSPYLEEFINPQKFFINSEKVTANTICNIYPKFKKKPTEVIHKMKSKLSMFAKSFHQWLTKKMENTAKPDNANLEGIIEKKGENVETEIVKKSLSQNSEVLSPTDLKKSNLKTFKTDPDKEISSSNFEDIVSNKTKSKNDHEEIIKPSKTANIKFFKNSFKLNTDSETNTESNNINNTNNNYATVTTNNILLTGNAQGNQNAYNTITQNTQNNIQNTIFNTMQNTIQNTTSNNVQTTEALLYKSSTTKSPQSSEKPIDDYNKIRKNFIPPEFKTDEEEEVPAISEKVEEKKRIKSFSIYKINLSTGSILQILISFILINSYFVASIINSEKYINEFVTSNKNIDIISGREQYLSSLIINVNLYGMYSHQDYKQITNDYNIELLYKLIYQQENIYIQLIDTLDKNTHLKMLINDLENGNPCNTKILNTTYQPLLDCSKNLIRKGLNYHLRALNDQVYLIYKELENKRNNDTSLSKHILTDDSFLQIMVSDVFFFDTYNENIIAAYFSFLHDELANIVMYIYLKFIIYLISQIILSIIFNFQMIPAISKNLNNLNRSGLVLKTSIFKKIDF